MGHCHSETYLQTRLSLIILPLWSVMTLKKSEKDSTSLQVTRTRAIVVMLHCFDIVMHQVTASIVKCLLPETEKIKLLLFNRKLET